MQVDCRSHYLDMEIDRDRISTTGRRHFSTICRGVTVIGDWLSTLARGLSALIETMGGSRP